MKCHNKSKDLAQGLGEPHIYCLVCGSHYYKNQFYTKKDWEEIIENNNIDYYDYSTKKAYFPSAKKYAISSTTTVLIESP